MSRPCVLVIDDLAGRDCGGDNPDRRNLCYSLQLRDITADSSTVKLAKDEDWYIADAVFARGQTPARAMIGDHVRNDLQSVVSLARSRWDLKGDDDLPWALVLLDLCFKTGIVSGSSEQTHRGRGIPAGHPDDDAYETCFGATIAGELRRVCGGLPIAILTSVERTRVESRVAGLAPVAFMNRNTKQDAISADFREILRQFGLCEATDDRIVGRSMALLGLLARSRRCAAARDHILVTGESGSGKELLADYIHENGAFCHQALHKVQVSAISPALFPAAMFGSIRGAYSDALDRTGLLVEANGGELFLDEIGAMEPGTHEHLLRCLEEQSVIPVGGNTTNRKPAKVRIISATDKKLDNVPGAGFPLALYNRLATGGHLVVPALRERRSDIPAIAQALLKRSFAGTVRQVPALLPDAVSLLQSWDWPGNTRELQKVVVGAAWGTQLGYLSAAHLEPFLARGPAEPPLPPPPPTPPRDINSIAEIIAAFDLDSVPQLAGAGDAIQAAVRILMARVVAAAIREARRGGASARSTAGVPLFQVARVLSGQGGDKREGRGNSHAPRRYIKSLLAGVNRELLDRARREERISQEDCDLLMSILGSREADSDDS